MADYERDFGKGDSFGIPNVVGAYPMAAAKSAYGRCMVNIDSSGYAHGLSSEATAGVSFVPGVASRAVDNSSGAAGAAYVDVEDFAFLDNDSTNPLTAAMIGRSLCYQVDNHTIGASDVGGTLLAVGVPIRIEPSTSRVAVSFNAALIQAVAGGSGAFEAVAVATNLAALTFTSGSFSADANGALASQDGQTLAVGDVVLIPEGTITTGTVSAANSGPYVLTSIGSASTKFTGVRPSWYRHGSAIPSMAIRVKKGTLFAGTRWLAFAMGTIGTTDPLLRPEKVTQKVTLVSSAKAITNVPLLSATRSTALCALSAVGGTTTSTVGYGIIVAPTPGGIGTATLTVNAIASGGSKNGTSDTSDVIVTIING